MKKNNETKLKVKGPEAIEDGLMDMGRAIEAGGPWKHPEMDRIPEWRGADIRITSDSNSPTFASRAFSASWVIACGSGPSALSSGFCGIVTLIVTLAVAFSPAASVTSRA